MTNPIDQYWRNLALWPIGQRWFISPFAGVEVRQEQRVVERLPGRLCDRTLRGMGLVRVGVVGGDYDLNPAVTGEQPGGGTLVVTCQVG